MIAIKDKGIEVNLRDALLEAKESIEGKRKLNTLDNLINELRDSGETGTSPEVNPRSWTQLKGSQ